VKRKIIHIDDALCNGCGSCIPNCPEGALQLIDGKARLISDLFCDGLGACIGDCPLGAITVEEREAEPYNERRVMAENIIPKGEAVIRAHLEHLQEHGEHLLMAEAEAALAEAGIPVAALPAEPCGHHGGGCPGSRSRELAAAQRQGGGQPHGHAHGTAPGAAAAVFAGPEGDAEGGPEIASELSHWPVQMHLIPPSAPYFRDADVLLAADCVGFAFGDFHRKLLRGKRLAIACPKLDSQQDVYLDKIKALIDFAGIRSLTVATMEVPCCRGLLQLARRAVSEAERKVPLQWQEISVDGRILQAADVA
jgi:ferredoxin